MTNLKVIGQGKWKGQYCQKTTLIIQLLLLSSAILLYFLFLPFLNYNYFVELIYVHMMSSVIKVHVVETLAQWIDVETKHMID